jgi:subtilisin family serine protease/PKD repeat protein
MTTRTTGVARATALLLGIACSGAWIGATKAFEPGGAPPKPQAQKSQGAARAAAAPRHHPEELLVKFREGVGDGEIEATLRAHGSEEAKKFKRARNARHGAGIERWRHVRLTKGRDLERIVFELRRNPAVERVEPNYEVRAELVPDDPRFAEQWALHNIGQTGGVADADIDAPEGWDVATGSAEIVVAVIDTGVDARHPDLAANMWLNPNEVPGNGSDDDGNGYVDDVYGYDFRNNHGDPIDDHGHGTHVAGIIAAAGNNGAGVSGVAWRARIMSVKFLGADGSGWISDAVNAVLYAADNGARVMNNSWGGGGFSQALRDAIAVANDAGILFVVAAGNNSSSNDSVPFYPASYDLPNVVAVAASDKNEQRAWFSNFGSRSVLLAAPGQDILSTVPPSGDPCCSDPLGYKLLSGTSMATPHVSGAAALLLAQDPARTPFNLTPLLQDTVDIRGSSGVNTRSQGRLNMASALRCDPNLIKVVIQTPYHGFVAFTGEAFTTVALVHACGYAVTGASVSVTFSNGDAQIALFDDGLHGDGAANDGVYGGAWTPENISSNMALHVVATDASRGSATLHRSGLVRRHVTYRLEPAAFSWIDPVGGTLPSFNFWGGATVTLGFGFEFYGQVYDTLFLNRSGYLSVFGPAQDLYWPTRLPDPAIPNGVIAPLWSSSLRSTPESRIYVLRDGAAPNRRLTVAWVNLLDTNNAPVTFQATLHEGSTEIVFQYQQVPDRGASASVGVENQDGSEGTQYSAFTPALQDASAVRFYPGPYNRAPTAQPGSPYTGVPEQPIAFDGTRSTDPENDVLTYRWSFGDGATATGGRPSHVYAAKGAYTATLTVNDGIHDSQPASTTVTVQNRPPVAFFTGPSTGRRGFSVNFDASGSNDPDRDVIDSYRWNFGDGSPAVEVRRMPTMGHIYSQLGTFTVTLVVNDTLANSAPVSRTVTISNVPPTADAGPDATAAPRAVVYLSSNSSDVDGSIVQYQWRQISGAAVTIVDANTGLAHFTAPNVKAGSPVSLEFELKVTDNDGAQASDRKIVTIVR